MPRLCSRSASRSHLPRLSSLISKRKMTTAAGTGCGSSRRRRLRRRTSSRSTERQDVDAGFACPSKVDRRHPFNMSSLWVPSSNRDERTVGEAGIMRSAALFLLVTAASPCVFARASAADVDSPVLLSYNIEAHLEETMEEVRLRGSSHMKPRISVVAAADHSTGADRSLVSITSGSSCKLDLNAFLSYDDGNIKVDTTISNLCEADAKLTKLTMSSCVKCDQTVTITGGDASDNEVMLSAQVEEEGEGGGDSDGDDEDRRDRQEYSECSPPVSVLQDFMALNGGSDVLAFQDLPSTSTTDPATATTLEEASVAANKFALAADLASFGGGPDTACSNRYFTIFSYEAEAVLRNEDAKDLQDTLNEKLEKVEYDIGLAKEIVDLDGKPGLHGDTEAMGNDGEHDSNEVTGQSITTSTKKNTNATTKNKQNKKTKRRFCPARMERSYCQKCQAAVRKQFDAGKCSNNLAAARKGTDCNRWFDKCRLTKFRRNCKRWRDSYANCFLPRAVSPNADNGQTCEKECKVSLNGESTYNIETKRVQMEVTVYNNCFGVIALEKLEYSLCTECTLADDAVEKICRKKENILDALRRVNGGFVTLPPDALRYLVLQTDEVALEGSCLIYAKLDYEAIAAVQVFHEVFEASVEVECSEGEQEVSDQDSNNVANRVTTTSGASPRPIQPSPSLDEAFQGYFQAEEECLYSDLDGCGGRDVVFAGVDRIEESVCVDVIDSPHGEVTDPNRRRDLQTKPKKMRRRKVLKIKGRNRKSGKCRRKCASRNKKVRDDISAPILAAAKDQDLAAEPNVRFLLALKPPRVECVNNEAPKPDLQKELEVRSDAIGFLPRRAAVTEVKELTCSTDSEACQDGSHKCCGTEGCSCGEQDVTGENCQAGTRLTDENILECFLSLTGDITAPNACCATSGCTGADTC